MLCGLPATVREDVLRVATPAPFSVPVPSVVAPSLNVTVPVAGPRFVPTPATVAVNVTDCPKVVLGAEEVSVVVDAVAVMLKVLLVAAVSVPLVAESL